ncbi:cytochrome P450 family protein [Nocardiopsis coralliicola]
MEALAEPFDLMSAEAAADPRSFYARMRAHGRTAPATIPLSGERLTAITRYEDVRAVLSHPRMLNNPAPLVEEGTAENVRRKILAAFGLGEEYAPYLIDASILDMDPPDHTRIRKHVSRTFTVRRVSALRPRVEEIAAGLLDALPDRAENGTVDLLEEFAYPLPITVICELVGVPEEQRPAWREAGRGLSSGAPGTMQKAMVALVEQARALVELCRAHPGDGLASALVRTRDEDGDRLSETELVSILLTLVLAGHETTANLIANGTAALLTHPEQRELLQHDRELDQRAVHELMRWCGPILGTRTRYPAEDIEIDGLRLPRGGPLVALLGAANWDPDVFDDPGRLDLTREPAGRRETHVGFSHGPHYCLGAALARQEGEVAFRGLLDRYPDLSLAVDPGDLRRAQLPLIHRLKELPVRLG